MGRVGEGFGRLLLLLVASLPLFGQLCEGVGYEQPASCGRLECPAYQVDHTQKEFEIRRYEPATWVGTPAINSSSFKDATATGFNILFSYIQGKNKEGARINMTAPVVVDIYASTGNTTFKLYFYVPKKYELNPPLSDQVHPARLPVPPLNYAAVRRFGGFMDDNSVVKEASALKNSLKGTPWESTVVEKFVGLPDLPSYTVAGYNSPFEHEDRVNEILLWLKRDNK
ncbi:hypothetical protein RJ639_004492 [Escallonia herrerae]|uniref:Heme-binding protein 2 n=1 Tax=Escallonia herrerae TaxID=1293975 RepID=A0AA89AXE2_9ASTE|nr:hypothetical protein RJ639_004492 [Escallonia herrerae]